MASTNDATNVDLSKVKKNLYTVFFKLLAILLIPAILGAILGRFLDNKFDIYPWGTLGTLLVFNILTWLLIIRYAHLLRNQKNNNSEK